MKYNKFYIIIACAATLAACAPKPQYTLVWEDNFDAPELNADYWNVDDNARGGGNAELQYYAPKNVTIEKHPVSGESCLVLNAQREDYYYTTADGKQGYRPATVRPYRCTHSVPADRQRLVACLLDAGQQPCHRPRRQR